MRRYVCIYIYIGMSVYVYIYIYMSCYIHLHIRVRVQFRGLGFGALSRGENFQGRNLRIMQAPIRRVLVFFERLYPL